MLRSLKNLERYEVRATDGTIGTVVDFLLEEGSWTIRYLVVDTGGFIDRRRVLISPISFRDADWSTHRFHVALTMDRVKRSPDIDADKPVSRQHERDYYGYYGYPYYWGYSGLWGAGAVPGTLAFGGDPIKGLAARDDEPGGDPRLRSANELRGYHVRGNDDAVGHVDDFIVDDETWELRYLVIDTKNWWIGKKVLVAPRWANRISWVDREVHVDMSREAIKRSPEWDPAAPINREYEARLYDYYGRPVYWAAGGSRTQQPPSLALT